MLRLTVGIGVDYELKSAVKEGQELVYSTECSELQRVLGKQVKQTKTKNMSG